MADSIIMYEYDEVASHLRRMIDEQDITQREIGDKIGTDASHVSRALNPTRDRRFSYDKLYRMWKILKQEEGRKGVSAKDVMNVKIEWAYPDETIQEVGNRAMENEYTQLPVKEKDDHIGWITTEKLAGEDSDSHIRSLVDHEEFTTVPPYLDAETIQEQLNNGYRAMLVESDGEYLGLITPYDLVQFSLDE